MANHEAQLPLEQVTQSDTQACMSACISSMTPGFTESDISRVLMEDDLYAAGIGVRPHPARVLTASLQKIGLQANALYDLRGAGKDEDLHAQLRIVNIQQAVIDENKKVMVAYPRRREGQAPFLHFSVIGRDVTAPNGLVVMDPSEIDGGMRYPRNDEWLEYVTPEETVPVIAWTIEAASTEKATCLTTPQPENNAAINTLLTEPLWRREDIGKAIPPGTEHPSSVAMTTTDISDQFERFGGVVLSREGALPVGYPRFVIPPDVAELSLETTGKIGGLPYPTKQSAVAASHMERTYSYLHTTDGQGANIQEKDGLFWLPGTEFNVKGWQHTGLGISSRQAAAHRRGKYENDIEARDEAQVSIKAVIAEHSGAKLEDIYLFPTGMAAVYWLNQALIKARDGAPLVQFGFPYSDTYDQRNYGPDRKPPKNILDFRDHDYDRLEALLADNDELQLRGVMTEFPSNPLLATTDYQRLARVLDGRAPIIIDDTVGTMFNLDDSKLPDAVVARVTSLTKFVSGNGNVMGGSIVLRPESPDYAQVKAALENLYENTVWHEDAHVLANNSQQFTDIMPRINHNGDTIAEWLTKEYSGENEPLAAVYHPSVVDTEAFDAVKKDGAGRSGLMTLRFNDPEQAFRFFDAIRVTKGPSLGTKYTIGCLYTLLAHKRMLAHTIEEFGVTPDLVRLSLGVESTDDLQARFEQAFTASA
jgi:cystathionine gamma-synthase